MSNDDTLPNPLCDASSAALVALTLGEPLAPDEQERLLAHLVLCPACRQRLNDYAAVGRLLPFAAPEAMPSAALRGRILAAAEATRAPAAARPPQQRAGWLGWQKLARPAFALALVALIALGAFQQSQIIQLQTRVAQQQAQQQANLGLVIAAFGNDDSIELMLAGSPAASEADGRIFVSPSAPAAAIYARRLPQIPPGQEYQAWFVSDGQVISAGRFSANSEGRAWRPLRPAAPLGSVERVFVTAEPTGGSAQPTGPEYLSGTPRPVP
jgi:anti-sigma-K factor RskA